MKKKIQLLSQVVYILICFFSGAICFFKGLYVEDKLLIIIGLLLIIMLNQEINSDTIKMRLSQNTRETSK